MYRGRLSRLQYFLVKLFLSGVFYIISLMIESSKTNNRNNYLSETDIILLITFIIYIFFDSIITVKRFHDLGYSGLYYFLTFIPIINIYYGLLLIFRKGDALSNQYGNDPLEENNYPDKITYCINCKNEIIVKAREINEGRFVCPLCCTQNLITEIREPNKKDLTKKPNILIDSIKAINHGKVSECGNCHNLKTLSDYDFDKGYYKCSKCKKINQI